MVSFCSFSFSRGLVLGLALLLFYNDNRMGGCFVLYIIITIIITIYIMFFFMLFFFTS